MTETSVQENSSPSFSQFDLLPQIVTALEASGITHAFPIQALTLPLALEGKDIIGQAKTGTGKTLGFGLPLLNQVIAPGEDGFDDLDAPGQPQALIVVPTRELATQVATDLETASKHRKVRISQIYGGKAYQPQIKRLKDGAEVVVGTPGRLIDLLNQGILNLGHIKVLVLDEADEMLNLGFLADVELLISKAPAERQTMLFSATMPAPILSLSRKYLSQPTHIRATDPGDSQRTVKSVTQHIYQVHPLDKDEVIARILQAKDRQKVIIFCRTKRHADSLYSELRTRGFDVATLHGDLGQIAREKAMKALRDGKVDVLVATDVAARGLDVDDISHVINYQCPEDSDTYLHRIGRTGRAGKKGIAITFVEWDEQHRWRMIAKEIGIEQDQGIEIYSSSPQLYEDLNIDPEAKGRLKSAKPDEGARSKQDRPDKRDRQGGWGQREKRSQQQGSRSRNQSGSRDNATSGGRNRRRKRNYEQLDVAASVEEFQAEQGSQGTDAAAEQGTQPTKRKPRNRRRRYQNRGDKKSD